MEGLISLLYWSMVFLEPTLLIPEDMPPIPVVVDCALHLYPALFLWIDFLVFNINFKRSPRHVAVIYGFAMFYLAWSWLCQTQNGHWPYPFLDKLTPVPRAGFYLFCGTLCWIIYEAGNEEVGRIMHMMGREKDMQWEINPAQLVHFGLLPFVYRCRDSC